MSAQLIDFESAREKEKKREWEREARKAILEKAKGEYEVRRAREEAARQRGEHSWMLPSVEANLDDNKKKKKSKKEKKKKKKKEKKTKKSRKDDDYSSSSESDGGEVWVERSEAKSSSAGQGEAADTQPRRDGWMEMTSLFGTFSREQMRERDGTSRKKAKEEEARKKREEYEANCQARELNPYYKNGGTGLPEEQPKTTSAAPGLDASWLRRALQRAEEQAKAENKSLEEIAAQRWGSLAKFHELLAEAEGRGKPKTDSRSGPPRHRDEWGDRDARDKRRGRSGSRERRGRGGSTERRKDRSGSRERRRDRSRERRRNRSGSRDDKRKRRPSRDRRRSSSSSSTSSGGSSSRSRDRHSGRDKRRGRSRSRDRKGRGRRSSSSSSDERGKDRKNKGSSVSSFMRPPQDNGEGSQSTNLSARFQRPGENTGPSLLQSSSRGSRGWQKKKPQTQSHKTRSSSSSSSSSSESDERMDTSSSTKAAEPEPPREVVEAPQPAPKLLTDKEMNDLAAKIMKAELVGNESQAEKLKKKLDAARAARAAGPPQPAEDENTEEVVVLTRMDARGISRPVVGGDGERDGKRRKKLKTHQDGQRVRYFPDDDRHDLKSMFEREKGTTADEQNSLFERAAVQGSEKFDEEYDLDDMFMTKSVRKEDAAKQAERDRQKAIDEHKRSERSLESCQWCFDNKEMPKHLIVALGTKAYVCLPPHQSLTPGHCLIVPVHHVSCGVQADEDLWAEIQMFRKSLVRMFSERDEDCIFFETAKRLRNFPHMALSCVPLPREMGDMAPIYFKKAIMECEAEWAQNKKLVDLKGRDVRKAVPKGLPYFFVDFAMDPGYAHVIEDEQDFPHNFAQEIVGGMLDLENNLWRKPRRENFDAQRKKVMEFSEWYKEFDPTQNQ